MTINEAIQSAVQITGPADSVCFSVTAWRHRNSPTTYTYRIWSDSRRKSWEDDSVEKILITMATEYVLPADTQGTMKISSPEPVKADGD